MSASVEQRIEQLAKTVKDASNELGALLRLQGRVQELEKAVDSPKETLIRLQHVDLGLVECAHRYQGLLHAYEVEVPSALVSPARARKTTEYSLHADYGRLDSPDGFRSYRRELRRVAAAQLGTLLFENIP